MNKEMNIKNEIYHTNNLIKVIDFLLFILKDYRNKKDVQNGLSFNSMIIVSNILVNLEKNEKKLKILVETLKGDIERLEK